MFTYSTYHIIAHRMFGTRVSNNGDFSLSSGIHNYGYRHMLHNPVEYPEPDKFKPERFLKEGIIDPAVRDPTTIAFGFGRR